MRRSHQARGVTLGTISAFLIPMVPSADAQNVRIVDAPARRSTRGFTRLTSLVELGDGSTVVVDAAERVVFRVTWPAGTAAQLVGTGAGPQEVGYPRRALAFGDGRAVIDDAQSQRWIEISADGEPGGFYPLGDEGDASRIARRATGIPFGPDAIVFEQRNAQGGASIMEWNEVSGKSRPRGRRGVPRHLATAVSSGDAVPSAAMTRYPPFVVPTDLWTASSDGWIAIVSSDPYRLQMFSPDGRRFDGTTIPVPRVPVTRQTREEVTRELARQRGRRAQPDTRYDWPDALPAFHSDLFPTLHFAPDGKLWVRRTVRAEDRPTFDVFSREAQLVERVLLPDGARLLGLGAHALYLVVRDADDLEFIQRVPFQY